MTKMIFVNLPVADVAAASAFYTALGFQRNATFSNEHAASMQWSDAIVVMLLDHALFANFTDKRIVDPRRETGALISLSCDSRAEVDALGRAALDAGGREVHGAEEDGPAYSRAFEDPDGHGWGIVHVDMAAMAQVAA